MARSENVVDEEILQRVSEGLATTVQIAQKTGKSPQGVRNSLRRLERQGLVQSTGLGKARRWNVVPASPGRSFAGLAARRDRLDAEIREVEEYLKLLRQLRRAL